MRRTGEVGMGWILGTVAAVAVAAVIALGAGSAPANSVRLPGPITVGTPRQAAGRSPVQRETPESPEGVNVVAPQRAVLNLGDHGDGRGREPAATGATGSDAREGRSSGFGG